MSICREINLHWLPLADHHRGLLGRLYGQYPGLTTGIEEQKGLVLACLRFLFALTFTCGTTPHNGQIKLFTLSKSSRELGFRSRPTADREWFRMPQEKAASGGCALSPQPEGWGTSLVLIVAAVAWSQHETKPQFDAP